MNGQVIEFDIPLFGEKVFICISEDVEKLNEYLDGLDLTDSNLGLCFGAMHRDGKYRRVVWLREWDIKTFIHEAYHLTKYILDHAGVECHETGAFMIEYIYSETAKLLEKDVT